MLDEIFEGNLRDKCFDVIFHANRSVSEVELERFFTELVALRELSAQAGITNEQVNSFIYENTGLMQECLSDVYIELTSSILSKNE